MYSFRKTQLRCLVVMLPLLLVFTLYPPLSSGEIDLQGTAGDGGPAGALLNQNSTRRLIGTAVSIKNPADNFAVIEDITSKKQWIYREGDFIGEMVVKEILPDRVIVDGGGGGAVLKLRRSLTASVAATPPIAVEKTVPFSAEKAVNRAGSRNRHYLVNGNEVAAVFTNSKRLHDTVDMHYVDRTQRNTGIRIGSFRPESVFASMGLRRGDLLLGINEQPVTGTDDAVAKLQTMLDDGQAELKVRRQARTPCHDERLHAWQGSRCGDCQRPGQPPFDLQKKPDAAMADTQYQHAPVLYKLSLESHNLQVIGTDGGLLDKPYPRSGVLLSPGERIDMLVKGTAKSGDYRLRALPYARMGAMNSPTITLMTVSYSGKLAQALPTAVNPAAAWLDPNQLPIANNRTLILSMGQGNGYING